jgi:hypothetical protein
MKQRAKVPVCIAENKRAADSGILPGLFHAAIKKTNDFT